MSPTREAFEEKAAAQASRGLRQNVTFLTLVWSGSIFSRMKKRLSQAPGPRQDTHKQPCHALRALSRSS